LCRIFIPKKIKIKIKRKRKEKKESYLEIRIDQPKMFDMPLLLGKNVSKVSKVWLYQITT
jgi:hypothetical protein